MKPADAAAVLQALASRDLLDIVDSVCAARLVTRSEICGRARTRRVCRARQELWWRLRRHPGMSYDEIGALFARDHSTVITGIRAYERASREDEAGASGR